MIARMMLLISFRSGHCFLHFRMREWLSGGAYGLLIKQDDTDIPLFDTTLIHAKNAALISIDRA